VGPLLDSVDARCLLVAVFGILLAMIASCSQLVGCRAKMDSIPGESLLPTMILVAYALMTVW